VTRVAVNAWFWASSTSGSGQYVRHLVPALATEAALELEIVLVAPRGWIPDLNEAVRSLNLPNVNTYLVEGTRYLPPAMAKVWFEQIAFPAACSRLSADLAHVPYWAPPYRPTVPTIVTIHDLIPLLLPEYRRGLFVGLYTALVSRAVRSAASVLTDSEAARRDITRHLALPAEHLNVINLAADKRFSPDIAPGDAAIRRRYDLPEHYTLYLGGFDVRKDVRTILQAWQRAGPVIGTQWPLVIAGRLPERDSAFAPDPRRQARELGVDDTSIRFPGFVEEADKPALYRSALSFVFPSRYEGFGLPPLEAMACGTPVICCRAASLPEVVGEGGMLEAPGDASGIASAMIALATDPELRSVLRPRALRQAAKFGWARTARETLAVYRAL